MIVVMQGFVDDAFGFISDAVGNAVLEMFTFVLGFFPDGDPAINRAIESWGFNTGASTFNVLYFVDFGTVMLFVGLAVAIPFVVVSLKAVHATVDAVNGVLGKLPFKLGGK